MGETSKRLEREHDEGVARQHGQRFTECTMDRRPVPPRRRVVEAREIVVNERRAVQQFDRRGGGVG